jgi:hypothetical protein
LIVFPVLTQLYEALPAGKTEHDLFLISLEATRRRTLKDRLG